MEPEVLIRPVHDGDPPIPGCVCSHCEPARYRHPLSQAFVDHFTGLIGLHDRKQSDYGRDEDPFYNIRQSANWGVEPWVGALIRLDDKVGRLRNLIRNGGELQNESVEDSLDDIAVYAWIARVLLGESKSARSAQG